MIVRSGLNTNLVDRYTGTAALEDVAGNVYPPVPVPSQTPLPEPAYPADEVLHVLKSMVALWQPPVWTSQIIIPPNTVGATEWTFNLDGLWYLSRVTLFPWNARTVGTAYTAAVFPSQAILTLDSISAMPMRFDQTHDDKKDLRLAVMNGTKLRAESADGTNYGVFYLEFEKVQMPDYRRSSA